MSFETSRPQLTETSADNSRAACDGEDLLAFAHSVSRGLSAHPKRLESRYLYDARGSALFEAICEQPEYYLTRTEAALLQRHAEEIARLTGPLALVELGAGSAVKTQILLARYCKLYQHARYAPIDVSLSSLLMAQQQLAQSLPAVECLPIHATYEQGLAQIGRNAPVMLLFLGSTMGNLDVSEMHDLWGLWADRLRSGDFLLLGVDINTDAEALDAAYNDAAGVSAEFTLNLFSRINRELGSNMDLGKIEHVAKYSASRRRVEIWAKFRERQDIEIAITGRRHRVAEGELIQTEISRRFTVEEINKRGILYGFKTELFLVDDLKRFSVFLLRKL